MEKDNKDIIKQDLEETLRKKNHQKKTKHPQNTWYKIFQHNV